MNVIAIVSIGLTVSLLARLIARRKRFPGGWVGPIYGVLGAVFAGGLAQVFNLYEGLGLAGYVMSAGGAIVFVTIHSAIAARRASA
jgi:uncharacterized membrane protein YeaQ/YmgE (transglycosylase-associated protein family)